MKIFTAIAAALSLVVAATGAVGAADYSSSITSMGTSLVADLGPNVAAAIGVGLLIFALLFGASLVFSALGITKKGKKGA